MRIPPELKCSERTLGEACCPLDILLPATSFVPFTVRKIRDPVIPWSTSETSLSVDLGDYSFCVPQPGEPDSTYDMEEKVVLAERYGGDGLGGNGGGARCGYYNGVQVKGIGRTPVAGSQADYWHSHGSASYEEAIREALWGEICHVALPWGSARVLGIILVGTESPYDSRDGHCKSKRALIVREARLRPAHFMRAILYRPQVDHAQSQICDTQRTRAAVDALFTNRANIMSISWRNQDVSLLDVMLEMLSRFADQLGTAMVKRIMHGALGSSNICFNGSFIDYGTITTISDYGRIIVAKNGVDMWVQHVPLCQTIRDLMFYLSKYLPAGIYNSLHTPDEFVKLFENLLADSVATNFMQLLGIPKCDCKAVDANLRKSFNDSIMSIVKAGNKNAFVFSPTFVSEMPERMGSYRLNDLMQIVAVCSSIEDMRGALRSKRLDDSLSETFSSLAWQIREKYIAGKNGESRIYFRLLLMLNALRINATFVDLYRSTLDDSISKAISSDFAVPDFIALTVKRAEFFLSDNDYLPRFPLTPEFPIRSYLKLCDAVSVVQECYPGLDGAFLSGIHDLIQSDHHLGLEPCVKNMAINYVSQLF